MATWADDAPTVRPFAEETLAFAIAYGRALAASDVARQHPEVRALAFWLREAPLRELQRAFESGQPDEVVTSPRGTVFHIPPGNVDTVFVYSWLLAALVGNRNLVRLPSGGGDVVDALAAVAGEVLAEARFADIRARTRLVHYGHDAEVTAAFSAAADVRVLWGGDASVLALRAVPLPPHATELTFPDRFAFALLDVAAVTASTTRGSTAWPTASSPTRSGSTRWRARRPGSWCGTAAPRPRPAASERFFPAVARAAERSGYHAPLSAVLGKFVHAAAAVIDEDVERVRLSGNDVFALTLADADRFRREAPGGGLFYELTVADVDELATFARRRDQTVTHFGFDAATLRALAEASNGRGIDRLVPVGQALALQRFWDGYDLLAGFTRLTHVVPER